MSPFSYKVSLSGDNEISAEAIGDELDKRIFTWMKHCLLPKLVKWCDQEALADDSSGMISNVPSLSLVDIEEYNDLYNELKVKYGLEMVKVRRKHDRLSFARALNVFGTVDLAGEYRSFEVCLRGRGHCDLFAIDMATGAHRQAINEAPVLRRSWLR